MERSKKKGGHGKRRMRSGWAADETGRDGASEADIAKETTRIRINKTRFPVLKVLHG